MSPTARPCPPRPAGGLPATVTVVGLVLGLTAAGCAPSGGDASGGGERPADSDDPATTVSVTLTPDGCKPDPARVRQGPVTFSVTNDGAGSVSEAELKKGSSILGEKENLAPGLSGTFSLRLDSGRYTMSCPGAGRETWPLTVTGSTSGGGGGDSAALTRATDGYDRYVRRQVALLVKAGGRFTDAVRRGDAAAAKRLYAPARYHYETVEPVAESFGGLDPAIDARAGDVPAGQRWTGFHRIEKALWKDGSLDGSTPVANTLDRDVARLQKRVATADYQPAQLANGASELLDEVARSKVTGEEDRYSHTDLSDFAANVEGARRAFTLLEPALRASDPQLARTVSQRFDDVQQELHHYRSGDGWVDYSTVGQDARRTLAQRVDALAEPLSQVAAEVA